MSREGERPWAWVLNLDAEYELEDPVGYTPSQAARQRVRTFAKKLSGLVRPGDVVVGENAVLQAVPAASALRPPREYLARAWCPTPRALALLERAGLAVPESPSLQVLQRVNDRRFGVELDPGPLGTRYVIDVEAAFALLVQPSPTGRWLLKRAFGLSGRGHLRPDAHPPAAVARWLKNSFARGHGVAVEPLAERIADFALHGWVARDGMVSMGKVLLQRCDPKGSWQETLPLPAGALRRAEHAALQRIGERVGAALLTAGYFGPFGVDAFAYQAKGKRLFQPLCEINARYSMGWALSGLSPR